MAVQRSKVRVLSLASLLACASVAVACADDDAGRFAADGTELAEFRVEPSALTLSSHEVALSVNESLQVTAAFARANVIGTADVTDEALWQSGNVGIAWVHQGTIVGVFPGTTEIAALYAGNLDSVSVTVTTEGLRAIAIQPGQLELSNGSTATLRAFGVFSQDARRDISELVTWTSLDPSIAEVEGQLVRGRARGDVGITATLADVSGRLDLHVTDALLLELTAVREREQMEVDTTQQLRARARFSDGETVDVTDLAAWSSDDGNLASVDDNGLVNARGTGEVGIWARYLGMASQTSVIITPVGQADPE